MKTHAQTTKALSRTLDSTVSTLTTKWHRLPRNLRRARRLVTGFGSDAVRFAKRRPAGVLAGLLLVGAGAWTLARRA